MRNKAAYILPSREEYEGLVLNIDQAAAFDRIVEANEDPSLPRFFIVSGQGGTGKTHLIKKLAGYFHYANKRIMICASTGRAAAELQMNARTVHSQFYLEVNGNSRVVSDKDAEAMENVDAVL